MMTKQKLAAAIRAIITTSHTEEEIIIRLEKELRMEAGSYALNLHTPTDNVGREARVLVSALGGMVTAGGAMVMIMYHHSDGSIGSL